jgi:hypothetical protein
MGANSPLARACPNRQFVSLSCFDIELNYVFLQNGVAHPFAIGRNRDRGIGAHSAFAVELCVDCSLQNFSTTPFHIHGIATARTQTVHMTFRPLGGNAGRK